MTKRRFDDDDVQMNRRRAQGLLLLGTVAGLTVTVDSRPMIDALTLVLDVTAARAASLSLIAAYWLALLGLVVALLGARGGRHVVYPEAVWAAGAPTIFSIEPTAGPSRGGPRVVIRGTGIVCAPVFPTVSFGGRNPEVVSCDSHSVAVVLEPHAPGAVAVTVTNIGGAPSNALTFEYRASPPR